MWTFIFKFFSKYVDGPVAQGQSSGLIIRWLLVRIRPGPFFLLEEPATKKGYRGRDRPPCLSFQGEDYIRKGEASPSEERSNGCWFPPLRHWRTGYSGRVHFFIYKNPQPKRGLHYRRTSFVVVRVLSGRDKHPLLRRDGCWFPPLKHWRTGYSGRVHFFYIFLFI